MSWAWYPKVGWAKKEGPWLDRRLSTVVGSVLGEGVDFAEMEPRTGCVIMQVLGSF